MGEIIHKIILPIGQWDSPVSGSTCCQVCGLEFHTWDTHGGRWERTSACCSCARCDICMHTCVNNDALSGRGEEMMKAEAERRLSGSTPGIQLHIYYKWALFHVLESKYEGDSPAPMGLLFQRRSSSYFQMGNIALQEEVIFPHTLQVHTLGSLRPLAEAGWCLSWRRRAAPKYLSEEECPLRNTEEFEAAWSTIHESQINLLQ